MDISAQYYSDITNFRSAPCFINNRHLLDFKKGDRFKGWYLDIKSFVTEEGNICLPTCTTFKIFDYLNSSIWESSFDIDNIKNYDFPFKIALFTNNSLIEEARTGNSALRYLLGTSSGNNYDNLRVTKLKGHYYYGLPGIILDEEGDVLYVSYTTLWKNKESTIYKTGGYLYKGNVHYIHPKIFKDSKNLFYKVMLTKLVPNLMAPSTWLTSLNQFKAETLTYRCRDTVQIKDTSSIIAKVKGPRTTEDMDNLSNYIRDNSDEIVESLFIPS